jgi:uncharacterized protein GlcG (DUF336 family)
MHHSPALDAANIGRLRAVRTGAPINTRRRDRARDHERATCSVTDKPLMLRRHSPLLQKEDFMGSLRIVAAASALVMTGSIGLAQAPGQDGQAPATEARPAPTQPLPPAAPPYGAPISFETAQRAMAAAEVEASKLNAAVVIAIIDSGGRIVMLHRLDGVQHASLRIAEGKARTALEFRRPTKVLEDAVARGGAGLRFLAVDDVTPLEGGVPIIVDGKIIGAVGVSGVAAGQDARIAQAAADAAK